MDRDRLFMDAEWVRLDNETNNDGVAGNPVYARNVRSGGGSIIGRVVRLTLSKYRLDVYVKGEFRDFGTYSNPDTAFRGICALEG